jgi:hypothetical protein
MDDGTNLGVASPRRPKSFQIYRFKYFTMQKYNLQKNPLQETKIPQATILYIESKHNILAFLVGKANKSTKQEVVYYMG